MRTRITKSASPRGDTIRIQVVKIQDATPLVTLEDPQEDPQVARGAFCRLRPPEGLSEHETASWLQQVAAVAIAVKVLPSPKAADVPNEAQRALEGEKVGTIREEAMSLAKQTKNEAVISLTKKILDDVGVR